MIKRFLRDETGAELAEYAVGAALVVAIAVVVYEVIGNAIFDKNTETGERIMEADYTREAPAGG